MSILNNRPIRDIFLKIAQQNQNSPEWMKTPEEQYKEQANDEYTRRYLLLKELMDNLEVSINNPPSQEDVARQNAANLLNKFTSGRENTQLFFQDVSSTKNFFDWLNRNKIQLDNKFLVISHSPVGSGLGSATSINSQDIDYNQLSKQDKTLYSKYPSPQDREQDDFQYWVNFKAVQEYLNALYADAKANNNAMLIPALSKLSTGINSDAGKQIIYNPKETLELDQYGKLVEKKDQAQKQPGKPGEDALAPGSKSEQDQSGQQAGGYKQQSNINELLRYLPFVPHEIRFDRILAFIQHYRGIVSPQRQNNQAISNATTYVNQCQEYLRSSPNSFALTNTPDQVLMSLNQAADYVPFLKTLLALIDSVRDIVSDLKEYFGPMLEPVMVQIDSQIPRTGYDSGNLYSTARSRILFWLAKQDSVIKYKHK